MKKNILLVQSLFLFPLVTTTSLLGMTYKEVALSNKDTLVVNQVAFQKQPGKKNRAQRRYEERQQKRIQQQRHFNNYVTQEQPIAPVEEKAPVVQATHQQLMNELTESVAFQKQREQNDATATREYHPIATNTVNYITMQSFDELVTELSNELAQNNPSNNIVPSEPTTTEATSTNSNLLQSVMMPTEDKGFSTRWEQLAYTFSTQNQVLQRVIKQLEDKTFDANNVTAIKIFTDAVTTATNNSDIESLATIADLCSKNYPQTIRIFDDVVAQKASGLFNTHYMTELTRANETMLSKRQEHINEWKIETAACVKAMIDCTARYNEKVKDIADRYQKSIEQEESHIKTLRTQVSTFSHLNRQTRDNTIAILTHNKLDRPTNKFAKTMLESESRLNSLAKVAQEMPQILTFEAPKQLPLLDEKK
jgi:hypothetical protein